MSSRPAFDLAGWSQHHLDRVEQALGLDGHIRVVHLQRRNHHRLVAALFFLGHEGDEDVL